MSIKTATLNGVATIEIRDKFAVDGALQLLTPGKPPLPVTLRNVVSTKTGEAVAVAQSNMVLRCRMDLPVSALDIIITDQGLT